MRDHAHEAVGKMRRRGVIAILDYRASKGISDIRLFLEKADAERRIAPKSWKTGAEAFRSLTVYEDGSCVLDSLSMALKIRRLTTGTAIGE